MSISWQCILACDSPQFRTSGWPNQINEQDNFTASHDHCTEWLLLHLSSTFGSFQVSCTCSILLISFHHYPLTIIDHFLSTYFHRINWIPNSRCCSLDLFPASYISAISGAHYHSSSVEHLFLRWVRRIFTRSPSCWRKLSTIFRQNITVVR